MQPAMRSLVAPLLPALLALTLLAACGRHDDHGVAPSASDAAAAQAKEDAAATAKCDDNPLLGTMPPRSSINGMTFRRQACTFNSIEAVYDNANGRQLTISITDTRSPLVDQQPMKDGIQRTLDMQRKMTQVAVQTLMGTLDGFQSDAASVEAIGGPDYLPVAQRAPTGEPVIIHVGAKTQYFPAEVVALLKDRYVLTIQAADKGNAVSSITTSQARALYEPFLGQMHLDTLP